MIERYFSQVVIHQGEIYRNVLLSINENNVELSPFECETAATIFISGCIVVCGENLNQIHLSQLNEIVKGYSIYEVLPLISKYIKDQNLFQLSIDNKKNQGYKSVTLIKYDYEIGWCII